MGISPVWSLGIVTRLEAKVKAVVGSLWALRKAQGRALEKSWEMAPKLDRLLADSCYVYDGVILGADVGDVPGVGAKVENIVGCCVGDGFGPNEDV